MLGTMEPPLMQLSVKKKSYGACAPTHNQGRYHSKNKGDGANARGAPLNLPLCCVKPLGNL